MFINVQPSSLARENVEFEVDVSMVGMLVPVKGGDYVTPWKARTISGI